MAKLDKAKPVTLLVAARANLRQVPDRQAGPVEAEFTRKMVCVR